MSPRIYAKFGVYGAPSDEREVLALANEYRQALVDSHQAEHEEVINLRNEAFPSLWAALVEHERLRAVVYETEREIKELHSDLRDRNVITDALAEKLERARTDRDAAGKVVAQEKTAWVAMLKAFSAAKRDAADWKNVKSLEKRRELYAALKWPESVAAYAAVWMRYDLERRELSRTYQDCGLHSAIRAEIVESTQKKLTKNGPGIRYRYGRKPAPQPWCRITIQFVGGLSLNAAIDGACPGFRLHPIYANHKASGEKHVYEVEQQIGTKTARRMVRYRMKLHKPFPDDAVFQRWTLYVDGERRYALPLLADVDAKPVGTGTLTYRLRWTKRKAGIEVAQFHGDHVNERLVLPTWLIERRLRIASEQAAWDGLCNDWLENHGVVVSGSRLQGVERLREYCHDNPASAVAANLLHDADRALKRARKDAAGAARCIEDIYRTVVARLRRLHSELVPQEIDLARLARYDTRNLLAQNALPQPTREIRQAVAVGKLQALLLGSGLASTDVVPDFPDDARETDVFTSYVTSLGVKTGTKQNAKCHRSQIAMEAVVAG